MLLRPGVSAAVVVVLLVAAGVAHADATVTARSSPNRFDPPTVSIREHERVTWTNDGGLHNVWFDDDSFEMPGAPSTDLWTVSRTFDTAGSFTYVCREHSSMTGTVNVAPAEAPGTPGGAPPGGGPPGGPGAPGPGAPGQGAPGPDLPVLKVTLKVSDATPAAGTRVRLSGVVRPARDGRRVQIQKRLRNGSYRTVASTKLVDDGSAKSAFSLRLRVAGDAVLRARGAGDDERASGVSATRRVDVHKRRD